MAKYLRYQGEFLSRASVIWRAEIWQESDEPFSEVGQLTFEADEALVIDYPLTAKHDVICGSSATLQIESPGDRTYVDLYTINPGDIRLDVYRAGSLYWSGTLDPEFYEEPYEKAFRYPVSLTFSDFSILDRLNYDLDGMQTVGDILAEALSRSGISVQSVDTSMISTCITGSPMSLNELKVRSDNFYDEDGEPMSLKEVIEGLFQPLGLRLVQRGGKIYVYDLNGLYNASESLPVLWDGDSSTLGVDAVYNNAKITWNQYAQSGNSASEECWTADCDLSLTNPNNVATKTDSGCQYLSYHYDTDLQTWLDLTDVGFTLWTSTEGENATLNTTKYPALRFFKIAPQYSGEECEGVAVFWNGFRGYFNESNAGIKLDKVRYGVHPLALKGTASKAGDILFSSEKVWIPQVSDSEARQLLVRIRLNLLVDPRFNPWEQAENLTSDEAEKDWQGSWKARGNFLYVPVTIKFQPDGSDEVYCWDNASVILRDVDKYVPSFDLTLGEWKAFDPTKDEAPDTWGYLAYYSPADRKESSGAAQGWAENRPTINPTLSRLSTLLQKCEPGQYLRYPTLKSNGYTAAGGQTSGSLWLEVRAGGWIIADGGVTSTLRKWSIRDKYGVHTAKTLKSTGCWHGSPKSKSSVQINGTKKSTPMTLNTTPNCTLRPKTPSTSTPSAAARPKACRWPEAHISTPPPAHRYTHSHAPGARPASRSCSSALFTASMPTGAQSSPARPSCTLRRCFPTLRQTRATNVSSFSARIRTLSPTQRR